MVKAVKKLKPQDDYVPSSDSDPPTDSDESDEEEEEEGSEEGEEEVDDDMNDDADVIDLSHSTAATMKAVGGGGGGGRKRKRSVSVAAAGATVKAAKAKKQPASVATKVPAQAEIQLPAQAEIKGRKKVPASAEMKGRKTMMKSRTEVKKGRAKAEKIVEKINLSVVKEPEERDEYVDQDNRNTKILDVSLGQNFNKSKFILDDRHYAMIGTTQIKNRGVSFDQLVMGRNPLMNPKDPEDKGKGAFRYNMPLRTIEPFYRAICHMTFRTPMDRNGHPITN